MPTPNVGKPFSKDKKEGIHSQSFEVEQKGVFEPEVQPAPEIKDEEKIQQEKEAVIPEEPKAEEERPSGVAPAIQPSAAPERPPGPKSETLIRIEKILEEDLEGTYATLDEPTRLRFRTEGERTATQIEQLIQRAKVKVKEILDLIRKWLLIIPGVNKFFIEQETKIKTDKIMALKER